MALIIAPMDSTRAGDLPFRSNSSGAETTYLEIVLKMPENEYTVEIMENIELRVRYLLDYSWRGERGISPTITAAGDNSIGGQIWCMFDKYMGPTTATELWVRYIVCYERNVPK